MGLPLSGISAAQIVGVTLITACLDVILILEHLFWYIGGQIDEQCAKTTYLDYLHIRSKVAARIEEKLDTNSLHADDWPNES